MTDSPAADLPVVRIKLGPDRPAPKPDPFGRSRIGYLTGLTVHELWERGRGVWKAKLPNVAAADLVLLVANDVVVGAGSIDGVTFHGDRIAIAGHPDAQHPLIGQPDPLTNASRNPIAYGIVRTVPPAPAGATQRASKDVLADAISVLTEAARLRRPRLQQTATGGWEDHPTDTDPADWAELVTLALAGAAANVGGVETALAGRSGSWEAAGVRSLLESAVGADEAYLWEHRTEPVQVTLNLDELLADRTNAWNQYDQAEQELQRRAKAAEDTEPIVDVDEYAWVYDQHADQDPIARSPEAPPWSWDTWRAGLLADGADQSYIDEVEAHVRNSERIFPGDTLIVPKSPEAGAELDRLEREREARLIVFDELEERLEQQREREWAAYGDALKAKIEAAAKATPGLAVPVEVLVDTTFRPAPSEETDGLTQRWIDAAVMDTSSPADLPGTPLERLEDAARA